MKYLTIRTEPFQNQLAICGIVLAGILLFLQAPVRANWSGFRGPTGLGYTTEANLPITWGGPVNENVLWSSPLPGQGHASPIVWDQAVIVCTVHWPADVEDRKRVIPAHHVTCYRTSDGELLWDTLVSPGPWLRTGSRSRIPVRVAGTGRPLVGRGR
jgi:hypothetical protein